MYLSFEQKKAIFNSYHELVEKVGKDGRYTGYDFNSKKYRKKEVACQLTHTGNGYIYVGFLPEYKDLADERGFLKIKNMSESELRVIIEKVIESFR